MSTLKRFILVLNSGSSTLKFQIFKIDSLAVVLSGNFEKIGLRASFYELNENGSGRAVMGNFPEGVPNHDQALKIILGKVNHWHKKIAAVGHRVVHGGEVYHDPTVINKAVIKKLEKLGELAPLHNPINVSCIKRAQQSLSQSIKHVAIFDTAFYADLPDYAYTYGLPYDFYTKLGIRKYGFHGTSHQYVTLQAAHKLKKPLNQLKLISCHLGSGCSITAVKNGKAVDTSMGFTPLAGLVMGTRSGDFDPAIILHLMKHLDFSPQQMETILNFQSGLKGVFGYSRDMRDIMLASGYKIPGYKPKKKFSKEDKARAKLALNIFVYTIVRYIGQYATVMGGVDAVIFTAGIGERNADVRRLIQSKLRFIRPYKVLTIPTNEGLMMAQLVKQKLRLK
ncbi:MAG: acetate kinase [Candidatus Buchananbacteria bacterium CG10_big_fil_rev_8_21_14_0_10_42_9]|uniref:Acetate kinase n=1 Tax=Candidatus Buchananbacteria bacterium CG10_big_fil_rev_8_21_14_0_10_42_9 TaxID=1974526 RepID=A0A2H0W262_9BACT|nr:MAG: acetate kinase [Candidatus Buchananbacteria bacterium CG10_big_fil_rev_8_21_14_0_10_42_9]